MAEELIDNPSRFLEVATATKPVPELVSCDEFADFAVEVRLLYFELMKA